ncbi:T9SS type A sorting domain-containing protein [candidate division WOR-3 bacterium]|nr:T9SS type A sorting domain-containing protein [candidate division WOR-3 bacterium]
MKRFSLILILAIVPVLTYAGWWKVYGGTTSYDGGRCVQETSDGGYVVTGYTASFVQNGNALLLLKTDSEGDTLWLRTYGGDGTTGLCVQQTSDAGFIIAGVVYYPQVEWGRAVWLLKTDESGDTLWTRKFPGNLGGWWGSCVRQTSDEGYIIAGTQIADTTMDGEPIAKPWLIKTDSLGDTLWTQTYGEGSTMDHGYWVEQTSDGGYILAGETGSPYTMALLIKTDSEGNEEWMKTFDLWEPRCVRQASDGGYVFTGRQHDDLVILKTDEDGLTSWARIYGGSSTDRGFCIQETSEGGYVVVGETQSFGAGSSDVWLVKTDSQGDTLWTKTFGGETGEQGDFVQQTSDRGYIITGITCSFAPVCGVYLIKTDSLGLIGVEEEPIADVTSSWEVTPIGSEIVLRFTERPEGFHAAIFNASGQKVDELHSTLTSRTIKWGEGFLPGVYFIVPETQGAVRAQKVVLIR